MSSPSKAKGTRWESQVVSYLRKWWPDIDRRPLSGRYDRGDITYGPRGWTIEAKNEQRITLARYMWQGRFEADNNNHRYFVVIIKNRRGRNSTGAVQDAYALMPLGQWAELIKRLEDAQSQVGQVPA